MDIRIIQQSDLYLEVLSDYFRVFYEKEPWGDYKGCDYCFGLLPLNEAPRFGKNEEYCTHCRKLLGPFWSVSRCKSALEETNLFIGLFSDNNLKGWIIAKPVSEEVLAIDYVGLDPGLRRKKPKIIMMKEMVHLLILFYIRKQGGFLSEWANKRLLRLPIMSLQLYCFFEEQAKKMGYKRIQSTTHKNAKNIYYAFSSVGFKLTNKSLPNNRVLFVKELY